MQLIVERGAAAIDALPPALRKKRETAWHDEVETAIDTQLRQRYLSRGRLRCGVYVVGWFECSAWHKEFGKNYRPKLRCSRCEFAALLCNKATELETEGPHVRAVVLDLAIDEAGTVV